MYICVIHVYLETYTYLSLSLSLANSRKPSKPRRKSHHPVSWTSGLADGVRAVGRQCRVPEPSLRRALRFAAMFPEYVREAAGARCLGRLLHGSQYWTSNFEHSASVAQCVEVSLNLAVFWGSVVPLQE